MHTLKSSAQLVQKSIQDLGLECQVVQLSDSTRSAQEAASAIGCEVGQIVKSLIFMTKNTQRPVMVLASGPNRVNEKVIEAQVGEPIGKADADFTRDVTGFAIGGIPPIGHKTKIELIFIDEDLVGHDTVWAAAGTPNAVFCLKSEDLSRITSGRVTKIS